MFKFLLILYFVLTDIAIALELEGELIEGGLIRGLVESGSKVKLNDKKVSVADDGGFIIGFHRDTEDTMELVKQVKFINSYSFVFSPRPGTAASNLKLIDQHISKKRLKLIQNELFSHQSFKNKMTENTIVNVLVENKIKNQRKFFGRTDHMTAVIFDGEENIEGKIVPVLITHSNQNNLFGKIKLNKNIKAA